MRTTVRGKDRLFAKLKRLAPAAEKALGAAAFKGAGDLVAQAKNFVPVRSGRLRESIVATPAGQQTPPYSQPGGRLAVPANAAAVTVGNARVRYGHLVEYGTAAAPAQPFFWPAYRLLRRRIRSRMARALNTSIKKVAG